MKYTLDLDIDLPRSEVAKLFGDPANLPMWQPGFVSIEPLDDSEGSKRHRLLYRHGKREVELIETVEVDNLPEEFTARYDGPGMWVRVSNRFAEAGADKTRWTSENEGETSGLMMKVMALLMPGCFKRESLKYMLNFKAFAEDGADVRDAAAEEKPG